jgi:hypothetical protein
LRGEIWDFPINFSGHSILLTAQMAINSALNNEYPIDLETHLIEKKGILIANSFQELTNWLNLNLNFLDEKILIAEIAMIKNNEFNPDLFFRAEKDLTINMLAETLSKTKSINKRKSNSEEET